jgi:hypothetical protein
VRDALVAIDRAFELDDVSRAIGCTRRTVMPRVILDEILEQSGVEIP